MKYIKIILILLISAGLAVWYLRAAGHPAQGHSHSEGKEVYYCPMHPYYRSDRPGHCPICNMKLVKMEGQPAQDQARAKDQVSGYAAVHLSSGQQQLIGIKTTKVKLRPLRKTVHAYGYIAHETELYKIQNEFIDAYLKYITVYRDYRRIIDRRRSWETHRKLEIQMLEAEHKLLELGLSHEQFEILKKTDWAKVYDQPELMFLKSENNYWIIGYVFEDDLGYVEAPQRVEFEISAYREKFKGTIRSVAGAVDPESRTARILIEPDKPLAQPPIGLLVNISIDSELGRQLSVPKEAVMDLGSRQVVFVETTPGHFEPREVRIGAKADRYWAVEQGLKDGETVVVDGNFMLDSESRLTSGIEGSQTGGEIHGH